MSMFDYLSDWKTYVFPDDGAKFATDEDIKTAFHEISLSAFENDKAGIPLLVEGDKAWVNDSDEQFLIAGETGSAKTRRCVSPLIHTSIKAGKSMVVTDVKGELSTNRSIYEALNKAGYKTVKLDFRNFSGDGYNVLEYPVECYLNGEKDKAVHMVKTFVSGLFSKYSGTKADPYWAAMSSIHVIGIIVFLMELCVEREDYKKYVNMLSVFTFGDEKGTDILSDIVQYKYDGYVDNNIQKLKNVLCTPERTKMSIVSTTTSVIGDFVDFSSLLRMLSASTFNVREMYEKPTCIFMIIPDETSAFSSIAGTVIDNMYQQLIDVYTNEYQGKRKPNCSVSWIADEFCNLTINDMSSKISASRSRCMNWFLIVQSLKQLENVYKEEYSTIIGNCKNVLYLQSSDPDMQRYVSELAGKTSVSYSIDGEPLLPVEQLKKLKKTRDYKEAVFIRDSIVYKATLPDIDSYPFAREYVSMPCIEPLERSFPEVEAYTPQKLKRELDSGTIHLPFTYVKNTDNEKNMSARRKPAKKSAENFRKDLNKLLDGDSRKGNS